jgi:hypothetical protein
MLSRHGEKMSRKDDVNKLYKNVTLFKRIISGTFYLNIVFYLVSIYYNDYKILVLQIIIFLINILVTFISDYISFPISERERLRSNIKNALGVDITEYDTVGYYNNKQQHSIHKLILNTFENIFFTRKIINKMIVNDWKKPIISLILLTFVFVFPKERSIILITIQSIFSSNYLIGYIKLFIFKNNLDELNSRFRSELLSECRKEGVESLTKEELVLLITDSVEYELLKSSFKVMPSSKVFHDNNEKWSSEWDQIADTIVISKK